MPAFAVSAPAKLNLFLHITGKRADGYHLLESLVAFSEFGDRLEFSEAKTMRCDISGSFAGGIGRDNLVIRAAQLLDAGCAAHIRLDKQIPVSAGLGGGSSDAAAAFNGLAKLWGKPVPMEEMALSLGTDVPVCLLGKTALVNGVGEKIAPVALRVPVWVLLVNPGVPLLSKDVYGAWARHDGEFLPPMGAPDMSSFASLIGSLEARRNALEKPALALAPVIGEVLAMIRSTGPALARMSGSGATCFGLYEKEYEVQQAAETLRQEYPGWWVQATSLKRG